MDKPCHLYFHSNFFSDGFVINFPALCIILRYSTCNILAHIILILLAGSYSYHHNGLGVCVCRVCLSTL